MQERVMQDPQELCDALEIPFSSQQLTAITAPLEPGVIIAGAGSGKTTVMAARVVWLVGTGAVRPEDVLGLTFTRKAAAELAHRVKVALTKAGVSDPDGVDEAGEQVVMTYDAFAGRMVAEHGVRLGVETDPVIITGATRYRLAAQVVAEAAGPFEYLSRLRPNTVIDRVLQLDAELTSHLRHTGHLAEHAVDWIRELDSAPLNRRGRPHAAVLKARERAGERLELASLVDAYQKLKRHLGLVEFGDQLAIAAQLAQRVPAVSDLVRKQWSVVLLDEYQDTSAAQAELLRSLFSGADPASGRGHAVTAVGDPCQAIYGWRGAAASNISQFAEHFPRANGGAARHFELTVNRRSGQRILDVANVLAAPLREDPYTASAVTDLVAPDSTPPGGVHAATFTTWPDEIDWIADQIVAAHPAGGGHEVQQWADIAVLTRRNADIGPLYAALTSREVPVEIVGLGGLLKLPEVSVVVDTLRLLSDVTANPEALRLLSGPRWALGLRDLALLGRRATDLATGRQAESTDDPVAAAVAQVDPTDVVALLDALADPGDLPYSAPARERFGQFVAELTELRRHADEPLPDLVRRVIDTTGLAVELAVADLVEPNRADHLAAFTDAVSDYLGLEPNSSLHGFLAWLDAELEHGTGLDQAVPSDRDSVKLLTVHKSKGLEWELVFVPALVEGVFPSDRVTDDWARSASVLPADLRGDAETIPQLAEASNEALDQYHDELKQQQHRAEHRLAYVAVTRARQRVVGTGHYWRPGVQKPKMWSRYLQAVLAAAHEQGHVHHEAAAPTEEETNPLEVARPPSPWPAAPDPEWVQRRHAAAEEVAAARQRIITGESEVTAVPLTLDDEALVASWDADLELLVGELAQQSEPRIVPLPAAISASRLIAARRDPQRVARQLVRPMPMPPSPAADLGIRFHTWVQRYLEMPALMEPDDLISAEEVDSVETAAEFEELCRKFTEGQFSARQPHAIEQAVTFTVGTQVIRARIDAIYAEADGGWLIVDWKTHHRERADAQQLAIYRLAWADALGIDVSQVRAGFYYVRTDRLRIVDDLPDRSELIQWVNSVGENTSEDH